ncbi:MAG: preprotein translocase subunit SecE [Candidatus Levybacteria bacterium]|nr:preprotein translocase subunit SecE [Candidatus Levybacteria bacterium]
MTGPLTFLSQTREELKNVTWPTANEVIRLTFTVVAVSLAVGLFIGALDFIFIKITESLVR